MARCPCGLGADYDSCCGRLHRGETSAATAEQLMRSRFSAFAVGDTAYLAATWHPSTRPARVRSRPGQVWTHLDVLAVDRGGLLDQDGTVTFAAHHETDGRSGVLRERSRFVRDDGRWSYVGPDPA